MSDHSLGDAPIEPELRELMNGIARGIDDMLNGDERPKRNGFILIRCGPTA